MNTQLKNTLAAAYMPVALMTQPNWKGDEFCFLIITYYKRFENFKKVLEKLDRWYPNFKKLVFVNGREDNAAEQQVYLSEIKKFISGYKNIQAKYFEGFVIPSKLWNLGFIDSPSEHVVVLNDSVTITGPFMTKAMVLHPFTKINDSFSNYVISKPVLAKIGWFDENLKAGASETDGDMEIRLFLNGLPTFRKRSLYITWKKFENPVVWDKKLGGVVGGKTSSYNTEYLNKKWKISKRPFEGGRFWPISRDYFAGPNPGFETPNPYPEVLKDWQQKYLL